MAYPSTLKKSMVTGSDETLNQSRLDPIVEEQQSRITVGDDAFGAPVETVSPLGYHVDWISVIFLNVSRIIGVGVFVTPATILRGVGSVGLSMIYWVIGFLFSAASLCVYLEYLCYYPQRSGGIVTYLEKAFPRPRLMAPFLYACLFCTLSTSSAACIVFAEYILLALQYNITKWNVRGVAVGLSTTMTLICILSTKWSLHFSNAIGMIKVLALVLIAITGLVVLCGGIPHVPNPGANFSQPFHGTSNNVNGLVSALLKIRFSYVGWESVFSMVNEVKDPIPTLKKFAPLSLGVVFALYILVNVAYFATVPLEKIKSSNEMIANLFFETIFPSSPDSTNIALTVLQVLVAISSLGSVIAATISASRIIRESGRQGLLPYPQIWASTKPFNTPLAAYLLRWTVTSVLIVIPPPGDAFNFIVDLQYYPESIYAFLLIIGLFLIRRRRRAVAAPSIPFRAWTFVAVFALIVNLVIMIIPWVPPEGGIYAGDVSFFYATYCIAGLGVIALSCVIYYFWYVYFPRRGGYRIRQVTEKLSDGAQTSKIVKVPIEVLEEWDAAHVDDVEHLVGNEERGEDQT
ncbi:high affinity methionine permease [Lentinula edodes]|uniref:High affinity methionine permease n=1 Tax=Lentinula edodes TaxID=5353 RepID=A0A1Q3EJ09_LENED|nr:high affinity methionine permease [Lentinula edodes]GAW07207.1 high affinity methionine permease [Lentinula edodes]